MKNLDILTALVAAGDRATQGEWINTKYCIITEEQLVAPNPGIRENGDGIDSDDADFIVSAANARPALRSHLAAVAKLVEAAEYAHCWRHGSDCDVYDAMISKPCNCGLDALRDALKEVDRDG